MLDKVVLSQDRKNAMIHFDTHSVGVYHSEGLVMDLVWILLWKPFNSQCETYTQFLSSQEDTQSIDLSQIDNKQAA